eukprot:3508832-Alexandrium_andersonii.AAC.1
MTPRRPRAATARGGTTARWPSVGLRPVGAPGRGGGSVGAAAWPPQRWRPSGQQQSGASACGGSP